MFENRPPRGEPEQQGLAVESGMQALLDAVPFYAVLVDAEHRILAANEVAECDFASGADTLVGRYCPKAVHGDDQPYPGCPLEESLETGHGVQREFFDSTNGRWVSSAIFPIDRKTPSGQVAFLHFITDVTDAKQAQEGSRRNQDLLSAINTILSLSLDDIPLDELLSRVLDLILSIRWLSLESKGSVFLVEDEPGVLVMKCDRGLSLDTRTRCARTPFNRCLCGRAAYRQETQFAERVDEHHEVLSGDVVPHGHYCVPIVFGGETLGVINLYVREGHRRDQQEEGFLTAIANSLAGVIKRKHIDQALKRREEELEIKTSNLEDMNSALKVLLERRDGDRRELEESVLANIRELVVVHVERLRNSGLNRRQVGYLDVLESNLTGIVSSFSRTLSREYLNLTPTEIQVADLVRQGKSTKEMAQLFNLSARTIEFHRQSIRTKLGIKNERVNLRVLLSSFQQR